MISQTLHLQPLTMHKNSPTINYGDFQPAIISIEVNCCVYTKPLLLRNRNKCQIKLYRFREDRRLNITNLPLGQRDL